MMNGWLKWCHTLAYMIYIGLFISLSHPLDHTHTCRTLHHLLKTVIFPLGAAHPCESTYILEHMRQTLPYTVTPGSEFRTAHQMTNHVTHSSELRKIKRLGQTLAGILVNQWNICDRVELSIVAAEVLMFSWELISLKMCNFHIKTKMAV